MNWVFLGAVVAVSILALISITVLFFVFTYILIGGIFSVML